ncbi:Alpha/Beta hydrolase protein [Mucidula mucida]|nr:Alpha/Beta hydrolase protein [Mucidula mucida]
MIYVQDKRLALPDGRTLAYADNGNTSSSTVILYLHGAFGVGDASRLSPTLLEKNVHFVAPSLPGWGESSPVPDPSHYAETFADDISALFIHLRVDAARLKIIICGYAFGTVAAQMLYGAPISLFPLRRQICSMILLAPHSPPHCHKEYARDMSWQSYFLTGPPSRYIPFNLLARVLYWVLSSKVKSEAVAEGFVRRIMFSQMTEGERERYQRWREARGMMEGQWEKEMGANMVRSFAQTWQGFLDIPAVYHSGWGGVDPRDGNKEAPVYIVSASKDLTASLRVAEWLARAYKSSDLRVVDGSHVSILFYLDEVWKEILDTA